MKYLSDTEINLLENLLKDADDGIFKQIAEHLLMHIRYQQSVINNLRSTIFEVKVEDETE